MVWGEGKEEEELGGGEPVALHQRLQDCSKEREPTLPLIPQLVKRQEVSGGDREEKEASPGTQ